ncbi:MAG TPA: glycosyltransferase family 4 protein [Nocardioides sp.]|nr:glycosyltransferase family 4 protein [Nocardioides sp.]
MRVVYVSTDAGVPPFGRKGASAHVQAILKQLLRRGDEVHLVTSRPGPVPGEFPNLRVHALPTPRGRDARSREVAARETDRTVAAVLDRLHATGGIDLVYERYALWGRTAMAWARARGVAGILEVNAPLPLEQARHRLLADPAGADAVARSVTADAEVVVCVSEPVAAWVRGLGGASPSSVHVVPNGVDTERFRPVPPRSRPGHFTVGFVGTLKPWHGVQDLVEAVALLHASDPTYRLLVVGDGPGRPALEDLAARRGLAGAIELTGGVPPSGVPRQVARMDVAVAPYPPTDDFYFSPLKIYEYLAAGVPVVASDVGPVPELLGAGGEPIGALYRAGCHPHLAATIIGLRHDPARRADLGRRARAAMVEGHDWSHVLQRTLDLSEVLHADAQAS